MYRVVRIVDHLSSRAHICARLTAPPLRFLWLHAVTIIYYASGGCGPGLQAGQQPFLAVLPNDWTQQLTL